MSEGSELRRVRLKAPINEASGLLPIDDPEVLTSVELDEGYWLAHDEGGLNSKGARSIVSVVGRTGDEWFVRPLNLATDGRKPLPVTDAEALAAHGEWVFVVGSGFLGANDKIDGRRSFVSRFRPAELEAKPKRLAGRAEILDLGVALLTAVNAALDAAGVQLIETIAPVKKAAAKAIGSDQTATPINIEGAACIGSSLFLGFRWPVSADGQPLIVEIERGAELLASPWNDSTAGDLASLPMHVRRVHATDATKKKALGLRALSASATGLHAITGPTDRDIAAAKLKAGAYTHVAVDLVSGVTTPVETFEGYRKVEALAPRPGGGWIYGLDDEKAIVLLVSDS